MEEEKISGAPERGATDTEHDDEDDVRQTPTDILVQDTAGNITTINFGKQSSATASRCVTTHGAHLQPRARFLMLSSPTYYRV